MRPTPRHTVQRFFLPRRTLLRGALGGVGFSLGLPVLDGMLNDHGTALAQTGAALPVRFGVFYWGGGITHKYWVPAQTGMAWDTPDTLLPFDGLKPYVTVVTGTNHDGSSPGHIPARGIALSSSHDMTVCQGSCVGTYRGQNHPEPSIDQLVAEAWKGKTRFDSLEIGICRKGPYKSNSSWKRGGTTYNRHEPSPLALWNRLFQGDLPAPQPGSGLVQTTTAYEKSMLDSVIADANALKMRVGSTDRQRLDQHLEGLRTLEQRLQEREKMPATMPAGCAKPAPPPSKTFGDDTVHEEKEEKSKLMSDLLAVALACDLTRVFSYEWSATQSEAVYWELGKTQDHHNWNHDAGGSLEYSRSIQFIMKNFAYLAQALKAKAEGTGNLLDRALILGTSEHANAGGHDWTDHPFLLVGKAGGGIKAGQHHRVMGSNRDAPKVLFTAVRAVGVPLAQLGQLTSDGQRVAMATLPALMP